MAARVLLRADREGYGYKDLLEIAPGRLLFLVTDRSRRRAWWLLLGALESAYLAGVWLVLTAVGPAPQEWLISVLGAIWGTAVYTAFFWAGFLAIAAFGDHRMPTYLATRPLAEVPLELVGATSYSFFQELQVRTGSQVERITVNGTRRSVARAFRAVGMEFAASPS